ncbi:hypothetical protein ACO0SA_001043 [Hanseniaspora valbyensis]
MFGLLSTIAKGIKNFLIDMYWEVMATKIGEIITISNEKNYNHKKYQKQSLPNFKEITQTVHLPNYFEKSPKHQPVLNISKEQGIQNSTIINYNLLTSDFIADTPLLLDKITNVDKTEDIIISDPELRSDITIETSKDIDLGTVKHFNFEDWELKKEILSETKNKISLENQIDVHFFLPLCREEQKNDDVSKSLKISLNEKERNTNLENFLLKALNIKKKDASFLNNYMNKTILLKKNKTLSQKILTAYQDKDSFEALLQLDPEDKISLVDELLFTHNVDSIKSILIALILIFKYKQPTSIYKATITSFFENLSVFLSKFKNTAFESKDLDLFHIYVIAIMDSISLANKEKVEMINLKKFIKTLMTISVSKNLLNDRSKEAFFCCCFIVCGLRFSNVIKFFDDLFPFKEIKKITNNESTIVKHSLFYLSLCKIILLNYIVKDIASMSDLDKFIKLLFTHLNLEFFQNNELLKNDLREIQYIQQFCSEHLNM